MPKNINMEMDPIFEIAGLLVACCNYENIRPDMIKAFDELGLDGETFYAKHLRTYDRYIEEFKNTCSLSKDYEFFFRGKSNSNFLLIPLSLMTDNRDMLPDIDDIEDTVINNEILNISKSVFDLKTSIKTIDTLDDAMEFLAESSMDSDDKWKLIRLMQNPKKHFKQFMNIINNNFKAYEKAVSCIKPELTRLISQYGELMRTGRNGQFNRLISSLSQTTTVYPTLAFPISVMVFEKSGYYGLLSSLVIRTDDNGRQSRDEMLMSLKALSDRSKLEILSILKTSPMYNLEIAEQMGLTPATTSHHMGVLLACGFVGVSKRNGKVYYHMEGETIRRFINNLEGLLL